MDQGTSALGHAASSTGSLCDWEPKEGLKFSGRREYVARLVVYESVRRLRFAVTKDTGATLEHTCHGCRIGKITLRIKRTRDGSGGFVSGPATIVSVLSCPCTIVQEQRNFSNLASFAGLRYSSRPEFTEIGKVYFEGRRHSRRDSGNRIDYQCQVCRNGQLTAVLTPGVSNKTGRTTWTGPLTVVTTVNCTPECASSVDPVACDNHPKLLEAGPFLDSRGCFSIQEDSSSLELMCQSVIEQNTLEGRYEVLELNGLTDRAQADDFMKQNNLLLEQKVESVADTCATVIPTKRHRATHLRKQMKMHNFFKVRE
jgi:hypothetical protein